MAGIGTTNSSLRLSDLNRAHQRDKESNTETKKVTQRQNRDIDTGFNNRDKDRIRSVI